MPYETIVAIRHDIEMASRPGSKPKSWQIEADLYKTLVADLLHYGEEKHITVLFEIHGDTFGIVDPDNLPPNVMLAGIPVFPYEAGKHERQAMDIWKPKS